MAKQDRQLNPPPKPKALQPVSNSTEKQPEVKSDISADQKMMQIIGRFKDGLREYEIRELVNQAEELGKYLVKEGLKTNQIRKFLDEVKRLKFKLSQDENKDFSSIKDEVFMLKPQLAWATARQKTKYSNPVQPFSDVISLAIEKVYDKPDFERLVQLIESIIAYHKVAGGRDN